MSAVAAGIAPTPRRGNAWSEHTAHGASGRRYFDKRFGVEVVRVLPGEYEVTADNIGLVTTLGSCVSACVRDVVLGIGGINHFMLPESELDSGNIHSARYGSYAMEVLVNELLKQGAYRRNLEAKVFGGANVLRSIASADVGARNAEFVRRYLDNEAIPVAAEDLGDTCPRKIVFFPRTGRVLVMRLATTLNRRELDAERAYQESLRAKPVAGDIELFD